MVKCHIGACSCRPVVDAAVRRQKIFSGCFCRRQIFPGPEFANANTRWGRREAAKNFFDWSALFPIFTYVFHLRHQRLG